MHPLQKRRDLLVDYEGTTIIIIKDFKVPIKVPKDTIHKKNHIKMAAISLHIQGFLLHEPVHKDNLIISYPKQ